MNKMPKKLIIGIIVLSVLSLIVIGCEMIKEMSLEQEKTEDMENLLKKIVGKDVNNVEKILGEHISETTLTDLNKMASTKYFTEEELIHSRKYKIKQKVITVFYEKGIVSGWSQ